MTQKQKAKEAIFWIMIYKLRSELAQFYKIKEKGGLLYSSEEKDEIYEEELVKMILSLEEKEYNLGNNDRKRREKEANER